MCTSMIVKRLPESLKKLDTDNTSLMIFKQLPQSQDEADTDNAEADDVVESESYFHEFIRLRKSHLAKPFSTDTAAMSEGTSLLGRLRFGLSYQASHISIRTPDWLGNTVCSVMAHQSMAGWQLNLLSYAVVDAFPKSINDAIENDDLISLQKSLRQMSLTPHVHDQHGTSLLFVSLSKGLSSFLDMPSAVISLLANTTRKDAAYYGAVDVSRWLLSVGLYPGSFGEYSPTHFRNGRTKFRPSVDILRAFAAYAPDIVEDKGGIWQFVMRERTFSQYRKIQQVMNPELLLAPFEARLWHCVNGLSRVHWNLDKIMCLLPEMRAFSAELVISFWSMSDGWFPLSCLMAVGVSWELLESNDELSQPLEKDSSCSIIGAIARERFPELRIREGRIPEWPEGKVRQYNYFRILGITYGTLPEQWKIWFSIYDYEYAGDFWQMVENSAFSIPGSWEDDVDSDEEDDYKEVPWDDDDRGGWIVWSEYRKIRPPC
ncbi:Ankyrin repeat-containing protein [Colletotrichum asianum]